MSSATTSTDTSPDQKSKPSSGGGGANAVPENSPFAGLNFGNQKGPTDIQSDTGTLDYQKKVALFAGHVHAVQAGSDLTSNTLKVQYGQDFNDIRMMYADGDVRMSQGLRWITSDHAVLDQSTHILTFYGNPVAHDQKDQITGSTIKVDLVSGKSTVDKPRVIIFPREGQKPDNVNAPDSP
jgi:lipopolysaccharide transport protein LptA